MEENWKSELIRIGTDNILSCLINQTGSELSNYLSKRRSAKNTMKAVIKSIEEEFGEDKKAITIVSDFFRNYITTNYNYFSLGDIDQERQEDLWDAFCKFWRSRDGGEVINADYRENLVRCLNVYNRRIRDSKLTVKDEVQLTLNQVRQKRLEAKLDKIIDTLCLNTGLQESDIELEYLSSQVESVLKSFRSDLNRNLYIVRFMMMCLIVTIAVAAIAILFTIRYLNFIVVVIELVFFVFILLLTSAPLIRSVQIVKVKERHIESMCDRLLEMHYKLYERMLVEKMNRSRIQVMAED